MAGLPKSFAKMGFKKGWAAYRQSLKRSQANKRITKAAKGVKPPKGLRIMLPNQPRRKGSSMKISKDKLNALKARASSAVARAKNSNVFKNHGDAIQAVGLGAAGAVASSYALGMIPLPAGLPKPGAIKSGIQLGLGIFGAMQKNKQIKYAGYGAAVLGVVGLARELLGVATFAGEVDAGMFGDEVFMGDDGQFMGDPMAGEVLAGAPMGGASFDPFN